MLSSTFWDNMFSRDKTFFFKEWGKKVAGSCVTLCATAFIHVMFGLIRGNKREGEGDT